MKKKQHNKYVAVSEDEPTFKPVTLLLVGFSGRWEGDPVLREFATKEAYEEALASGKWKPVEGDEK